MANWQYRERTVPGHNDTRPNGCVLEHRLAAEQELGRPLAKEEVVHHIDGVRMNNAPQNLMVFVTRGDHTRFHRTGSIRLLPTGAYESPPIPEERPNICPVCGTSAAGKYCSFKCARFASRKVERPTCDDLAEMLRAMPVLRIGKRFGVTDNAVRRWARYYGLIK